MWLATLIAATIALAAWRARSLSRSGAVAALAVGTTALSASWGWGLYLVIWFASASALSRLGRARKVERMAGVVEKGDRRDVWQVVANGGVFLIGLLIVIGWPGLAPIVAPGAAAALAAAGADTWSTEIGTLVGAPPWSLRLRERVPPGTSGAVSLPGSIAGVLGAMLLALVAVACLVIPGSQLLPVAVGGVVGAWTDTLVGAWLQSRRWCPRCGQDTEQRVHQCGTPTERRGGFGLLSNDGVNLLCTIVGAGSALCLSLLFASRA